MAVGDGGVGVFAHPLALRTSTGHYIHSLKAL